MDIRKNLLQDIERFIARWSLSERAFGLLSVKNHKMISRIREGKGINIHNLQKIYDFMENYPKNIKENSSYKQDSQNIRRMY